jgi:hypothetical protein
MQEAGDTSAVRPVPLTATRTQLRRERLSEAFSDSQLTGGVQILIVGQPLKNASFPCRSIVPFHVVDEPSPVM